MTKGNYINFLLVYLLTHILISIAILPLVNASYILIYGFNILYGLFFSIVLLTVVKLKNSIKSNVIIGLTVSIVFVLFANILSFHFRDNFFVFSEVDAIKYHEYAILLKKSSFLDSMDYYLKFFSIDDLGAIAIIRTVYLIAESNLIYNIYNIIISTLIIVFLYKLCLIVMTRKTASLCSLSFGLSSFMLWHHSSGLKESTMIFLVILFLYFIVKYLDSNKIRNLSFAVVISLVFIFYRPAITVFMLFSVFVVGNESKNQKLILLVKYLFVGIVVAYAIPFILEIYNKFLLGGDFKLLLEVKRADGSIKGGIIFTYAVNFISQILGPFPTLTPEIDDLSFYASGLVFRGLLAFPFIVGTYYVFKHKKKLLYPALLFAYAEMFSLIIIFEGLELRKSLPHLPVIYFIAFWFFDYAKRYNLMHNLKLYMKVYSFAYLLILILWNYR